MPVKPASAVASGGAIPGKKARAKKRSPASPPLAEVRLEGEGSGEAGELPWTGERLVPSVGGDIALEHLHRYAIAAEFSAGRDILDIACGEGYGSHLLALRARSVVGVDNAPEAIRHADAKYARANLRFREGTCTAIPLPEASVDVVVTFETIEHIAEHAQFLAEIQRVLRKDGLLVISTPERQNYDATRPVENPYHQRELSRAEFDALLRGEFRNVHLLGQRVARASMVLGRGEAQPQKCGIFTGDFGAVEFSGDLPTPTYLLAVCSDAPLPAVAVGSFELKSEPLAGLPQGVTCYAQVFADRGAGYSEALSARQPLTPGGWQTIRFEHLERLHTDCARRLRFDPVNQPALVELAGLRVTRETDGAVLFHASWATAWAGIQCSGNLFPHPAGHSLLLMAADDDPQIYLPPLPDFLDTPCTLAINLRLETAASELARRLHESARENDALSATAENLKMRAAQLEATEATWKQLHAEARAAHDFHVAEGERLRAGLAEYHADGEELRRQLLDTGGRLSQMQTDYERRLAGLSAEAGQLREEGGRLREEGAQLAHLRSELESRLAAQVEDAQQAREQLARATVQFTQTRADLERRLAARSAEAVALRKAVDSAERWQRRWFKRVFHRWRPPGPHSEHAGVLRRFERSLRKRRKYLFGALTRFFTDADERSRYFERQRRSLEKRKVALRESLIRLGAKLHLTASLRRLDRDARLLRKARLVDAQWYCAMHPEARLRPRDAVMHFLRVGAARGWNPSASFDTKWYLEQNPGVAKKGENPLLHYARIGAAEGRQPKPLLREARLVSEARLVDEKWYCAAHPEARLRKRDAVMHYLSQGARKGWNPNPLFDTQWYLEQNPDIAAAGLNPLLHYLEFGWREGRSSHPTFNPRHYLEANPDVAAAGVEPLAHYLWTGQHESRPLEPERVLEFGHEPEDFSDAFTPDVRLIAFYLPQFHAIPENDAWWGEGFTEWTNVRRGQPQFEGHCQPRVPHEAVGYYDLSDEAVFARQVEMARRFGLHGFCFYHYWFAGKRLLEMPVDRYLRSEGPDFPFCLCWANENWTRRWDGMESEILIAQEHSPESDEQFILDVLPALRDRRYLRMHGRPFFIIYRPLLLPDPAATFRRWREVCRAQGLGEIYLAGVQCLGFADPRTLGLDAAVEFPPHDTCVTPLPHAQIGALSHFQGTAYDYRQARLHMLSKPLPEYPLFRGVMPSWDNTARRQESGSLFLNATPGDYFMWLHQVVRETRRHRRGDERMVFVNAWNEWAEGCHLEPDAQHGFAWLNATRRALLPDERDEAHALPPPAAAPALPRPAPAPPTVRFQFDPLPARPLLSISVLFYFKEELIAPFLDAILPQVRALVAGETAACVLHLVLNYPAPATVRASIEALTATVSGVDGLTVRIVENGCNLGFGAAHNAVFEDVRSDLFVLINSDVSIGARDWLVQLVEKFRASDVALVGLRGTASRLREDGCGIPVGEGETQFDFVDGSAMALRSEVVRRCGLFDPAFTAFYFEDADLCLRLQQCGLPMQLLDVPYEHNRSASTRQLPRAVIERILDHNRARFFERWQPFLQHRHLATRLGVEFRTLDRAVQAAALPAIFGLLTSHPGATLEVAGLHSQLRPFYEHPQIHLVPVWEKMRPADYHRHAILEMEIPGSEPLALAIASALGCEPAMGAARAHLQELAPASPAPRRAVVLLARPSPLFHGREPSLPAQWALAQHLLSRGFTITAWTDFADFELQEIPAGLAEIRKLAGMDAGEFLADLASAEIVVGPDHWTLQLAQSVSERVFGWFGSTSPTRRLWSGKRAGFFADETLPCLGCHHRWGSANRAFCLRGDLACVDGNLMDRVVRSLEAFLEGQVTPAARWLALESGLDSWQRVTSADLDLSSWPDTQVGGVLVLIPMSPRTDPALLAQAEALAQRATAGMTNCRIVFDHEGQAPPRGTPENPTPHAVRQPALAAIRQDMIERHLRDERWVFWVDVDIVDYPENLIERLIERADGGIAAPLVLMEGEASATTERDSFGPGRFYDVGGFVEAGRWARFEPPYFDQPGPVFELDSVGSIYLVNADLYRHGAHHEADPKSVEFIATSAVWPADATRRGQLGAALAYTEHYSVCQFARAQGVPVQAFADLVARHQKV